MKRTNRILSLVLAAVVVLCFAACGNQAGETEKIDKNTTVLDLSGANINLEQILKYKHLEQLDLRRSDATLEQYQQLKTAMPDCQILWEPRFRSDYYPADTKMLSIDGSVSQEEIAQLEQFPNLTTVYAEGMDTPEQITAMQAALPGAALHYKAHFGGGAFTPNAKIITIEREDPAVVDQWLPLLKHLQQLTVTDPKWEDLPGLLELCSKYPNVVIDFDFDLYGVTVNSQDEFVDLSDIEGIDVNVIEPLLTAMPHLQTVEMNNCGIDNDTMDALNRRHEDVRFIWTVHIGRYAMRTDATVFIPVKYGLFPSDEEAYNLRYCTDMQAVDIGHMAWITNLDFVRYMPKLKYLIFVETFITDISPLENLQHLEYLEMFINPIKDISPLLTLPALKHLNLCYVRCEGDVDVVCQLTQLERLWWKVYGTFLTLDEMERINASLPNTEVNLISDEATSNGWRKHPAYFEMRDFFGMYYLE